MPGPAAGCQGSAPAHLLALVLKAEPSPAHRARTAEFGLSRSLQEGLEGMLSDRAEKPGHGSAVIHHSLPCWAGCTSQTGSHLSDTAAMAACHSSSARTS